MIVSAECRIEIGPPVVPGSAAFTAFAKRRSIVSSPGSTPFGTFGEICTSAWPSGATQSRTICGGSDSRVTSCGCSSDASWLSAMRSVSENARSARSRVAASAAASFASDADSAARRPRPGW